MAHRRAHRALVHAAGRREPGRRGRNLDEGGFATAPDLVRFAQALGDGTVLDRPYADLLLGAKLPQYQGKPGQRPPPPDAPEGFATYGPPGSVLKGQWVVGRAGGNAGSGANWTIYPDTGWVGVILGNPTTSR